MEAPDVPKDQLLQKQNKWISLISYFKENIISEYQKANVFGFLYKIVFIPIIYTIVKWSFCSHFN